MERELPKPEPQEEKPKRPSFPRMAHSNLSPKTPLDEQGYFKKGKVDSELLRKFTCNKECCTDGAYLLIAKSGIRNVQQMIEVRKRYEGMARELHSERINISDK